MAKIDADFKTFTLHIEGVNIDNLSLTDVGQYVADLAQLLGQDAEARFHSIRRGSLKVTAKVLPEHEMDVRTRGFLIRTGDAPEDAIRAKERISRRLGINRAKKATLIDGSNTKVIEIPVERPASQLVNLPTMSKSGSVQGQIIRIGGKQETVTVELQDVDGHVYSCKAKRDIAKKMAKEIFGATVRAHGVGRWKRDDQGTWYVEDFQVSDFDVLDDAPLSAVLDEIKQIQSQWQDIEDPLKEAEKNRSGE